MPQYELLACAQCGCFAFSCFEDFAIRAKSDAHASLRAAMYAKRTLMAGFTTVRNLGSRGEAMFALRDAIAAGHVPGRRSSSPVIRSRRRVGMRMFTATAQTSARCWHHPVCVTVPMIAAARCGYK